MNFFKMDFLKLAVLFVSPLFLASCQDYKNNYPYLMMHPQYLQRQYNTCVEKIVEADMPCGTILKAQADFTNLVNQREQNRENFGARVLQAQENAGFLKKQYEAAVQAYDSLSKDSPPVGQVASMRGSLENAKSKYDNSREVVNIFLAVISATSSV